MMKKKDFIIQFDDKSIKHMCSMKMVYLNTSGINAIFAETNNQTTRS